MAEKVLAKTVGRRVTVAQLIENLKTVDPAAYVSLEGCDCDGEASGKILGAENDEDGTSVVLLRRTEHDEDVLPDHVHLEVNGRRIWRDKMSASVSYSEIAAMAGMSGDDLAVTWTWPPNRSVWNGTIAPGGVIVLKQGITFNVAETK